GPAEGPQLATITAHNTPEETMTTPPSTTSSGLPGKPPIVDLATWQAAREELLVREKAHTREGDAIAAARRRLPMVEVDGTIEVIGADGQSRFSMCSRVAARASVTAACGTTARRRRGSARAARARGGT